MKATVHSWTEEAACLGMDVDIFMYGEPGMDLKQARSVCGDCPVRRQCARYLWRDQNLIVVGLTPSQRQRRGLKGIDSV